MTRVQETLQAWRDAERQLSSATDPDEADRLAERVRTLQDAYQRAVVARVEAEAEGDGEGAGAR